MSDYNSDADWCTSDDLFIGDGNGELYQRLHAGGKPRPMIRAARFVFARKLAGRLLSKIRDAS